MRVVRQRLKLGKIVTAVTERFTLVLIIGIGFSLAILSIRAAFQKDNYLTVEIIASGGDWWQTVPKTPYWLVNSVTVGGAEYSNDGKKIAELLEMKTYEEDVSRILWAKVRLLVSKDSKSNYKFRQNPLEVGSTITFSSNGTRLTGNVISILDKTQKPSEFKTIPIKIELFDRTPYFANSIFIGDQAVDENGNVTAIVTNKIILPNESGNLVNILVDLDIQVINRRGVMYFNQIQPVKIGNSLWIPLKNVNLYEAPIINYNIKEDNEYVVEKELLVTTKIYGQVPWFAIAIKIGDEAVDSQGNVIAKIVDLSVNPAEVTAYTDNGAVLVRHDPLRRDIVIVWELKAVEKDNVLFFNQVYPIKIGNELWIALKKIDVKEASIIEFKVK